ncbi:transporter [Luteibacter pinisoli]|uniref:Transporter n=2 Tax=Luteibacter pinisoli TaxID=2589080 RepID=A0A4Y5Z2N1_9GAMM|nr:transporter [Luteibacter pinisoli]
MEPRMTSCFLRTTAALIALGPAAALASTTHDMPDFTGPLVTPAVNPLPKDMLNIEPYLIHTHVRARYGNDGSRHALRERERTRQWQVALPVIYGLGETTSVQLTLSALRTSTPSGHTDGLRIGDTHVRLLQRLSGPGDDGTGWVTAVSLAQRLSTGKYHHLNTNPLNGTGNGTSRTTLAFGAQKLQWLADGRALRWRGQVAWSPSPGLTRLHGTSVYGTGPGFHGSARHGQAWNASIAAEYALHPRWVLVGEAVFNRTGKVRMQESHRAWEHRPSQDLSLAPAVEYHLSATLGLIAGVQFTVAGRNAAAYVAPQAALNMVF